MILEVVLPESLARDFGKDIIADQNAWEHVRNSTQELDDRYQLLLA